MYKFLSQVRKAVDNRLLLMALVVMALFGNVLAAAAQTPEPPPTISEMTTMAYDVIDNFGVSPIIWVGAVVGIAVLVFARIKRASR